MKKGLIEPVTEEDDPRTVEQRVDALGSQILGLAFIIVDRRLKGQKIIEADEEKLVDLQRIFKFIQTTYSALVRMNRIRPTPNMNFDAGVLQTIRDKKNTVGEIVQNIPKE